MQRADRRDPAGEDREVAQLEDRGQVADQAVDDESADPAVPGLGRDQVAEDGVHRRCARIDDDHVARLGDVEALVDHQVVARVHLDGAGRPEHAQGRIGAVADARHHGVEPVHEIGHVRCLEACEPGHDLGRGPLERRPDAEARPRGASRPTWAFRRFPPFHRLVSLRSLVLGLAGRASGTQNAPAAVCAHFPPSSRWYEQTTAPSIPTVPRSSGAFVHLPQPGDATPALVGESARGGAAAAPGQG